MKYFSPNVCTVYYHLFCLGSQNSKLKILRNSLFEKHLKFSHAISATALNLIHIEHCGRLSQDKITSVLWGISNQLFITAEQENNCEQTKLLIISDFKFESILHSGLKIWKSAILDKPHGFCRSPNTHYSLVVYPYFL